MITVMMARGAKVQQKREERLAQIACMDPVKRPQVFHTRLFQQLNGDYSLGNFEASHFSRTEGASFTGWVVCHQFDKSRVSDPFPTKAEALKVLRRWHAEDPTPHDYFQEVL